MLRIDDSALSALFEPEVLAALLGTTTSTTGQGQSRPPSSPRGGGQRSSDGKSAASCGTATAASSQATAREPVRRSDGRTATHYWTTTVVSSSVTAAAASGRNGGDWTARCCGTTTVSSQATVAAAAPGKQQREQDSTILHDDSHLAANNGRSISPEQPAPHRGQVRSPVRVPAKTAAHGGRVRPAGGALAARARGPRLPAVELQAAAARAVRPGEAAVSSWCPSRSSATWSRGTGLATGIR